ncbi:nitroreductase [Convivina praedatoris]|uniref:Chloronitrobenzene nitroreductase n=1 Tax=Convivina praedatoris TaxID=2880963 RepID=A0ABN8HG22_9LACO|nr:nitroreductase [Convivina sp. LMG 32447]CAH1851829.1 Chloronitrobenzene nitroreductase [Convivina sp. LMG 32447]CAH1853910.1 Chloronitrobenzene nitroreductase [Convivina sp. LMG 32447]CAH1854155.1 Chloronitrobenzene nitroreductase [Convivina sp. LMG 32447]
MEFQKVLAERRATRAFTDQPIALDDLQQIVQLAQQAPSWVNSQPVRVTIATGDTLAKMRRQHAQLNHNQEVHSHSVIPYRPKNEWDSAAQANMDDWFEGNIEQVGIDWRQLSTAAADQLYNAQAIVYLTLPKNYSEWSLIDTGAFSQNIMSAALDRGIASIPAFEFVKYADALRTNIQLPDGQVPIVGIGLGYADQAAAINKIHANRMPVDEVLTILK